MSDPDAPAGPIDPGTSPPEHRLSEVLLDAGGVEYEVDYTNMLGSGLHGRVFAGTGPGGAAVALKFVEIREFEGTGAWLRDTSAAEREGVVGAYLNTYRDAAGVDGVMPLLSTISLIDRSVLVFPRAEYSLADVVAARRFAIGLDLPGATPASPAPAPDDDDIRRISVELTKALVELHDALVMHRDIKPANALLWRGSWRWADFGIARLVEQRTGSLSTFTWMGTREYTAPEVLTHTKQTQRSDVYSLGCTIYELATGQVPFPTNGSRGHLTELPDLNAVADPVLRRALNYALAKSHDTRVTAEQLLEMLAGPTAISADFDGLREVAARGRREQDELNASAHRAALRDEACQAALAHFRRIWDDFAAAASSVDPEARSRHEDANRSALTLHTHRMVAFYGPSKPPCPALAVGTLSFLRPNERSIAIANIYAEPDGSDDGAPRWRVVNLFPNFEVRPSGVRAAASLEDLEGWLTDRAAGLSGPPRLVASNEADLNVQRLVDLFVAEATTGDD